MRIPDMESLGKYHPLPFELHLLRPYSPRKGECQEHSTWVYTLNHAKTLKIQLSKKKEIKTK